MGGPFWVGTYLTSTLELLHKSELGDFAVVIAASQNTSNQIIPYNSLLVKLGHTVLSPESNRHGTSKNHPHDGDRAKEKEFMNVHEQRTVPKKRRTITKDWKDQ